MRGLEFRTASTSIRIVVSSSNESFDLPSVFFRQDFTCFTKRSKNPPHHGTFARLNCHLIPLLDRCSCTSSSSNRLTKVFSEAWKVFALSETISFGRPRRPINLLRQSKKVGASRLETSSKCTAQLVAQVNRAIYTFVISESSFTFDFTNKGQQSQLLHS